MNAKIRIEHIGAGWIEIFKSEGMKALVDSTGQRIAAEAGEHFEYEAATNNNFTVAGFVRPIDHEGAVLEAEDKVLTKAVHA